jgi:hypothetical protein
MTNVLLLPDTANPWMQVCRACGAPFLMFGEHSTHTCPICSAATWVVLRRLDFYSLRPKLQQLAWERVRQECKGALDSATRERIQLAMSDMQKRHSARTEAGP